jgi:hypothetical protein
MRRVAIVPLGNYYPRKSPTDASCGGIGDDEDHDGYPGEDEL